MTSNRHRLLNRLVFLQHSAGCRTVSWSSHSIVYAAKQSISATLRSRTGQRSVGTGVSVGATSDNLAASRQTGQLQIRPSRQNTKWRCRAPYPPLRSSPLLTLVYSALTALLNEHAARCKRIYLGGYRHHHVQPSKVVERYHTTRSAQSLAQHALQYANLIVRRLR